MFGKGAKFWRRILYCKKVFEIFKIRVDKTNWLWYSVLATRLDEPNLFAGLRCTRKADAPAKASVKNRIYAVPPYRVSPIPPFHSLFSSEMQLRLLCISMRGIRCDWYRTVCEENKNGTCSLTTCVPRFLFLVGKPSQSSLTRCQLPRKGELYAQVRESGTFDWEEA